MSPKRGCVVLTVLYQKSLIAVLLNKPKSLKMAAATTLPKDVSKLGQEIKLFGKWETQEYVGPSCGTGHCVDWTIASI